MGERSYYAMWYVPSTIIRQPWIAAVQTLRHFAKFARENNISDLEIAWPFKYGRFDDFAPSQVFSETIQHLIKNFSLSVHGPLANLAASDLIERQGNLMEMYKCLVYAHNMGVKEVQVVHLADSESRSLGQRVRGIKPSISADDVFKNGMASAVELKRKLDETISGKFRIGFENLSMGVPAFHYLKSMEDLLGENYGFVIDAGHFIQNGIPVVPMIETWVDNTFEVHLSSTTGGSDDHCALGTGLVDVPVVIDCLRDNNYKGRIVVEVKPKFVAPTLAYLKRERLMHR